MPASEVQGRTRKFGHFEVFSQTCGSWVKVNALHRRHEGFDNNGSPIPASLVAYFDVEGLGRLRKKTARGSGLLRYVKPGAAVAHCSAGGSHIAPLFGVNDSGEEDYLEEHDPGFAPMNADPAHLESVFKEGLLGMGLEPHLAELIANMYATENVESAEPFFSWLLNTPQQSDNQISSHSSAQTTPEQNIGNSPVKAKCVYQDIVLCDPDALFVVGGTNESDCKNANHMYCYDCLWRSVRDAVRRESIPCCPGSNDLDSHRAVGGCCGSTCAPTSHSSTDGRSLLSERQLNQIMNGFFNHVEEPNEDDKADFELEKRAAEDGSSQWYSAKVERMWLNFAIAQEGGVACPNSECKVVLIPVEPGWVGPIHCISATCCFHQRPFCSGCRQPYHYMIKCDEVSGVQAEWLRWCNEGRAAFLRMWQEAGHGTYKRETCLQYIRQHDQRQPDRKIAAEHLEALERDEQFKELHCRLCPNCGRPVIKTGGCNSMRCGSDYHGGNGQPGCGSKFLWDTAAPYRRQVAPVTDSNSKKTGTFKLALHFLNGEPLLCDVCNNVIEGPLIECIHCPHFAACLGCDTKHCLQSTRLRRYNGDFHEAGHIFRVHLEAQGRPPNGMPSYSR